MVGSTLILHKYPRLKGQGTHICVSKRDLDCNGSDDDDVIKRKHFPRYWLFVWGIHRWPGNSPHKGQWRWAMMFSLICAWINAWVNNREAGDLRHHRAHYDVIMLIMTSSCSLWRHRAHYDVIACRPLSVKPLSELLLGCCLIRPLQTNFSGKNTTIFYNEINFDLSSAKWWLFCFGINE